MITEGVMLITVFILFTCGYKTLKAGEKLREYSAKYLAYFFFAFGIALLFYTTRMFFVKEIFLEELFFRLGVTFHVLTGASALAFSLFTLKPEKKKLWNYSYIVIFLIAAMILVPTEVKRIEIPTEPYEPFPVERTEWEWTSGAINLFLVVYALSVVLVPIVIFFYYGYKSRDNLKKKSYLISLGFSIFLIASILDGIVPWPALFWAYRLMYAIGAVIIYKAFST